MTFFRRWVKFSAVGATGILVQTATLAALLRLAGLHYLVATALAVEASVIHTFIWHRKWTWADRPQASPAAMLVRFNLTSGAMSLVGNLLLMFVLVEQARVPALAANMITVAICSVLNFLLSDRFVFI